MISVLKERDSKIIEANKQLVEVLTPVLRNEFIDFDNIEVHTGCINNDTRVRIRSGDNHCWFYVSDYQIRLQSGGNRGFSRKEISNIRDRLYKLFEI